MLLRAQMYDYTLEYRPGKDILVVDALSRAPLHESSKEHDFINNLTFSSVKDKKIGKFHTSAKNDPKMQALMQTITVGC